LVKLEKHSANTLPRVTLDKKSLVNSISATVFLPNIFYQVLGKDVADCHSVFDKEKSSQRWVTKTAPLPSVT
jgi:hypothetical protein